MTKLIFVLPLTLLATWLVMKRIFKLPSRYDRKPKSLSAWNSLDIGIDPSLPEQIEP